MGFIANLVAGPIFKTIGSVVNGWMERKRINAATKTTILLKKQEVITAQATADISWDQIMAKGSAESWKDEMWTVILAIPMVLAFVPGMDAHIQNGFMVLDQTPEYYKVFLGTAIAAAFGRSELIKIATKWKTVKASDK